MENKDNDNQLNDSNVEYNNTELLRKEIKTLKIISLLIIGIIIGVSSANFYNNSEIFQQEPEFELVLCDDQWNVLPNTFVPTINFDYDGQTKACNAILYRNKKEILRYDYKKLYAFDYDRNIIIIETSKYNDSIDGGFIENYDQLPKNKGTYILTYQVKLSLTELQLPMELYKYAEELHNTNKLSLYEMINLEIS